MVHQTSSAHTIRRRILKLTCGRREARLISKNIVGISLVHPTLSAHTVSHQLPKLTHCQRDARSIPKRIRRISKAPVTPCAHAINTRNHQSRVYRRESASKLIFYFFYVSDSPQSSVRSMTIFVRFAPTTASCPFSSSLLKKTVAERWRFCVLLLMPSDEGLRSMMPSFWRSSAESISFNSNRTDTDRDRDR